MNASLEILSRFWLSNTIRERFRLTNYTIFAKNNHRRLISDECDLRVMKLVYLAANIVAMFSQKAG